MMMNPEGMKMLMPQKKSKVLAHYYIDSKNNPFSIWRSRIAAELENLPYVGQTVIITPETMFYNETTLGPGVYKVIEVRPNKEHPNPVFDYIEYGSWYYLDKTNMIIVEPVYTVKRKDYRSHVFNINQNVGAGGEVTEVLSVYNTDTGEVTELNIGP